MIRIRQPLPYCVSVVVLVWTGGCRLPGSRGPVPASLVECRQLSQQGQRALDRHDWPQAERLLSQAVEACPVDAEARRHYAEALWKHNKTAEAMVQMEEALRLAGDDAGLLVRAAEMRLAIGQTAAARELINAAIDHDPKNPVAWAIRARVREEAGLLHEALADYHRSLRYAPDDRDVLLAIAELYRKLGEPQRALANLQSVSDTYPPGEEPQQVLYLIGLAYAAQGRHDDSIEALLAARERGPSNPDVLYLLASQQWQVGRADQAANAVRQALAVAPDHAPSRALLERIDLAVGSGPRFERR